MIKWFKALIIGIIIWYVITIFYGFVIGLFDLEELNFFKTNSYLHNFILYPLGIWLGFKITKTSFWGPVMKDKDRS